MNGLREIVAMNGHKHEKPKPDIRVQRDKLAQALRKLLKDPAGERAFAEKVLTEVDGNAN